MILTESSYRNHDTTKDNQVIITTSWDDGHVKDFRVAELLEKYNLQGTFYVSPEAREIDAGERLNAEQIRLLSQRFDLGAHTYSRPSSDGMSYDEAMEEVIKGKTFLAEVIGKKVTSFCYPYGKYNRKIARGLEKLGFTYARTVRH